MTDEPFDAEKSLRQLRDELPPHWRAQKRLTFVDRCAVYLAARVDSKGVNGAGVSNAILAKAFGVTEATISMIRNCTNPNRPVWRYNDIVQELNRLGEDAFRQRYWTQEHMLRIRRIQHDIAEPGDDRTSGPNPKADKFAYANYGPFSVFAPDFNRTFVTRVIWSRHPYGPDRPEGWFYQHEPIDDPNFPPTGRKNDATGFDSIPFATSAQAFDAAFETFEVQSPRPKGGRPRKKP